MKKSYEESALCSLGYSISRCNRNGIPGTNLKRKDGVSIYFSAEDNMVKITGIENGMVDLTETELRYLALEFQHFHNLKTSIKTKWGND